MDLVEAMDLQIAQMQAALDALVAARAALMALPPWLHGEAGRPSNKTPTVARTRAGFRCVKELALAVLPDMAGEFTTGDITKKMRESSPASVFAESSVAGALRRLAQSGKVKRVRVGRGVRGNTWLAATDDAPPATTAAEAATATP